MAVWRLTKEDLHDEIHKFLWDSFGRQVQELVENIQADMHSQLSRFLEGPAMELQPLLTEACKHLAAEQPPRDVQGKATDQDVAIMEGPTFQTPSSPLAIQYANPRTSDVSSRELATGTSAPPSVQPPSSVSEPSRPTLDPPALCVTSLSDDQAHRNLCKRRTSPLPQLEDASSGAPQPPGALVDEPGAKDGFFCNACRCRVSESSTRLTQTSQIARSNPEQRRSNSTVSSISNRLTLERKTAHLVPPTSPDTELRLTGEGDFAAGDRAAGMQVAEVVQPVANPTPEPVQETRTPAATTPFQHLHSAHFSESTHSMRSMQFLQAPSATAFSQAGSSRSRGSPSRAKSAFDVAVSFVKLPTSTLSQGFTFNRNRRMNFSRRVRALVSGASQDDEEGEDHKHHSSLANRHPWCRHVQKLVESECFDYCIAFCLVANAIVTGLQVNYMAGHIGEGIPASYRAMEIAFCVIFTTEIVLRVSVYRFRFFKVKGWQWNIFDTIVVGLQLTEEVATTIRSAGAGDFLDNLSVLRMLRLGRIVRLVRMVRLIPELKSMVYLIFASMWSFFWTTTLLVFFMYGIAVYFTELVAEHVRKVQQDAGVINEGAGVLKNDWGSVQRSILSLYQAITGGRDWADLTEPLMDEVSWLAVMVFTLYIAFATLVMLNLVTGVFVEGAQRIIKEDKDSELVKQMRKLFVNSDMDSDAEISWPEFEAQLDNQGMEEYFKAIDIHRSQAQELFCLLDTDESGVLSIEEFVRGCIRLRGPARSIDLAALMYDCTRNFKNLTDRADEVVEDLAKIKSCLSLGKERSRRITQASKLTRSLTGTKLLSDDRAASPRSAHSQDVLS